MMEKVNKFAMPSSVCNWINDFLTGRSHTTDFYNSTSTSKRINASVVQGSAIGPAAFSVVSSDLVAKYSCNVLKMFADDSYLIIAASNLSTTGDELCHIGNWSSNNNLQLSIKKCKEIIFYNRKRNKPFTHPPLIPGIERMTELKCVGVTVTSTLSFTPHISNVIGVCSSNLFALYTLRSKGLANELLHTVFCATTLTKLLYASSFWWGFTTAQEQERLEAFLRRAKRGGFYVQNKSFAELCASADNRLFTQICSNTTHVLASCLPPISSHPYNTRKNLLSENFQIPTKWSALSDKNFINMIIIRNSLTV